MTPANLLAATPLPLVAEALGGAFSAAIRGYESRHPEAGPFGLAVVVMPDQVEAVRIYPMTIATLRGAPIGEAARRDIASNPPAGMRWVVMARGRDVLTALVQVAAINAEMN